MLYVHAAPVHVLLALSWSCGCDLRDVCVYSLLEIPKRIANQSVDSTSRATNFTLHTRHVSKTAIYTYRCGQIKIVAKFVNIYGAS